MIVSATAAIAPMSAILLGPSIKHPSCIGELIKTFLGASGSGNNNNNNNNNNNSIDNIPRDYHNATDGCCRRPRHMGTPDMRLDMGWRVDLYRRRAGARA